jgi:GH15 family glucan-1,4-alpha-glucosidase
VKALASIVCQDWRKPGHGVWEIRDGGRHYVYNKAWCYVALDRASLIAKMTGHPEDAVIWEKTMKEIKEEVLAKGWSDKKNSLTMFYGSDELDAANLLLPLIRFLDPLDPKMVSTVEAVIRELADGDLVYRYKMEDGLQGKEGAFLVCSFWLVSCLAKMGRVKEGVGIFERLLARGNHLGLYSEEMDPQTGEALGNFPQAFTHLGLISAACDLDRALDELAEEGAAVKGLPAQPPRKGSEQSAGR